jgi:sulfate transport system ATP-binding protein
MKLTIENVQKSFGNFPALKGVNLDIQSGELLALLGPSGCGKTTLLRSIAGLEPIDGGRIFFGEEDATQLSVQARKVGFVFQHYALFKPMTVFDNIAFGLTIRPKATRPSTEAIRQKVLELLDLVQLSGLEKRYPAQLSGGQKQRVALARALAIEPRVLLLDEPFGALDAKVRKDLRRWLRELHDKNGITTIFVTHDQEEALELADRVVVMNKGSIEQVGETGAVYERPATPFVFEFLGGVNRLIDPQDPSRELYVRPHDLRPQASADAFTLPATLTSVQRTGALIRATAQSDQGELEIELGHLDPDAALLQVGSLLHFKAISGESFAKSAHPPVKTLPDVPSNAPPEQAARGR